MLVKLEPRVGEKMSDQIELANFLLYQYPDLVTEVELQLNNGPKYMRHVHDGDAIRKFIWSGYEGD